MATSSVADLLVFTWEQDGDLHSAYQGTLDLSGLTKVQDTNLPEARSYVASGRSYYINNLKAYFGYDGARSEPKTAGVGVTFNQSESSGDGFGYLSSQGRIYLPKGYVSGTEFSGASVIADKTLPGIGVPEPVTLTLSWRGDTITHVYGSPPPWLSSPTSGAPISSD